jgi:hypothetical protein
MNVSQLRSAVSQRTWPRVSDFVFTSQGYSFMYSMVVLRIRYGMEENLLKLALRKKIQQFYPLPPTISLLVIKLPYSSAPNEPCIFL